jgi:hypothetical protein
MEGEYEEIKRGFWPKTAACVRTYPGWHSLEQRCSSKMCQKDESRGFELKTKRRAAARTHPESDIEKHQQAWHLDPRYKHIGIKIISIHVHIIKHAA